MDDWSFQQPTFAEAPVEPAPQHALEQFRADWPYYLKWGVNHETGEPVIWSVTGGPDGRPVHRSYLRDRWGRDASVTSGDVIGLAKYIPAETRLDGTVTTPATVKVATYYGKDTPSTLVTKFGEIWPNAQVVDDEDMLGTFNPKRGSKTAEFDPQIYPAEANRIKWLWHRTEGPLVWRADEKGLPTHKTMRKQTWGLEDNADPITISGEVEEDPRTGELAIQPTYGLPPRQCISEVKNEVARQFPDKEIRLPDTAEDFGIEESYGTDGPQFKMQASVHWAQQFLSPLDYRFAKADMSGAMIAVFIPESVGKKLKHDGENAEPVENMHITLVYFKDKAADRDDWSKVEEIVKDVAGKTKKLHGEIGGYGVFQNNPDGDVLWAAPSVDGLAELRDELVRRVEEAGFEINRDHGWTPHITLIYGFEGLLPELESAIPITFSELTFARGEDKIEHAMKTGGATGLRAFIETNTLPPRPLELRDIEDFYHWDRFSNYENHAIPFVTDGKVVRIDMEPDEFLRMYPPEDRDYVKAKANLVTGWLTPTKDGLGYGISGGVGLRQDQPGAHEIMALLDQETGKPCHFVPDRGHGVHRGMA